MSVLVLLMRCFCAADFQLIEISILAPTPEQEQVTSLPLFVTTAFILPPPPILLNSQHVKQQENNFYHYLKIMVTELKNLSY
jgi:hypothetical protein